MLHPFFENIVNKNVAIIGDVMIDAYLTGEVKRISPEAPVPILDVKSRDYRLGGAANVALNIKELGANPVLFSVVGNDEKGALFSDILQKNSMCSTGLTSSSHRKTTVKYRLIGNGTQMMRIDDEDTHNLNKEEQHAFLKNIKIFFENHKIDVIIIEDYDKGVITEELIKEVVAWAQLRDVPVLVDPKKNNFHSYDGVTLLKPNLKEWCEAIHLNIDSVTMEVLEESSKKYALEHQIRYIMITLSAKGVAIWDQELQQFYHHPTTAKEVVDVSGAGDSVIAVSALAVLNQCNFRTIAEIANITGGVVCQYAGVVPIKPEWLMSKIADINC